MSIPLLIQDSKPHDVFDDLQSLLWVLLYFAVCYFKYNGHFNMRVFEETWTVTDEHKGFTSVGGAYKQLWLEMPNNTFECKPLQDFFTSFRTFHLEHHEKWAAAMRREGGEEAKKRLEEYEAEIKKDIYGLASHFNDILDDVNADWTGQEALKVLPEVPQGENDESDEEMGDADNNPWPVPWVASHRNNTDNCGEKRRREESEADDGPQYKRTRENVVQPARKPISHAPRRRRDPPAPCDRVLRTRTRK